MRTQQIRAFNKMAHPNGYFPAPEQKVTCLSGEMHCWYADISRFWASKARFCWSIYYSRLCKGIKVLKFEVQGSGKKPYTVTADGEGANFRIFCSCPAGRKGGMFCKHAAGLLVGDVTKLVGGGDVVALAHMAEGSPLVAKALAHRPASKVDEYPHIRTLEDVVTEFGDKITAEGFDTEIDRDPGKLPHRLPRDEIRLFTYFKNGKRRKTPSHVIYYEPLGGDAVWDFEEGMGEPSYANVKERARPWGHNGKTYSTLSRVIPGFLKGTKLG